jgi:hypothetical protein
MVAIKANMPPNASIARQNESTGANHSKIKAQTKITAALMR